MKLDKRVTELGTMWCNRAPVKARKSSKKGWGKRKPPIDVREEKHPLIGPRARLDLTLARETTPIARDQSLVLVATDVIRRNNGGQPLPRRHSV